MTGSIMVNANFKASTWNVLQPIFSAKHQDSFAAFKLKV